MKVKAIMFAGPCSCGRAPMIPRPSVEVSLSEHSGHEWLCIRCAGVLSRRLAREVARAKANVAAGLVYRHDEWVRAEEAT